MKETDLIFMGLLMLIGEVGKDFIFYDTLEEIHRRLGVLMPYRAEN